MEDPSQSVASPEGAYQVRSDRTLESGGVLASVLLKNKGSAIPRKQVWLSTP
jgi:hypothetical protein